MINGGRLLNIYRNKELSIDFKLVGENGQTNRLIINKIKINKPTFFQFVYNTK